MDAQEERSQQVSTVHSNRSSGRGMMGKAMIFLEGADLLYRGKGEVGNGFQNKSCKI